MSERNILQKILHPIYQNCVNPQGFWGKIILFSMNKEHASISQWGLSHISMADNASVLDAGCGGGANIEALLNLCPMGQVTGIDYSPLSVKHSQEKNSRAIGEGRCRILEGNVSNLPFPNDSFDVVTAFETIYFWPEGAFDEIFRVMKPHGHFLIVCEVDGTGKTDKIWPKIIDGMTIRTKENIIAELTNAGFENIKIDTKDTAGGLAHSICVIAEKENNDE